MLRRFVHVAGPVFFATITALMPTPANSAELLILEQEGCYWCERWHSEIGDIYPKTREAEIAPLRRVDIHDPWPSDLEGIQQDYFTPTFVLIDGNKEVGRLRGYPGEDFFWPLLEEIFQKMQKVADKQG